jgi:glutaredoxin
MNTDATHEHLPRPELGRFLFALGGLGVILGVLRRLGWPLPHYFGDWLLLLLALGTALAGAALLWRGDHPRTTWRPTQAGRRFQTLVLYTRRGCHLCDEAHALLSCYAEYLPEIVEVDIDADPATREKFNSCVPVVEIDGRIRFRGRVSEPMLQRLIEGTPPVPE